VLIQRLKSVTVEVLAEAVNLSVLGPCDGREIGEIVVEGVLVDVVDEASVWNRPVVVRPDSDVEGDLLALPFRVAPVVSAQVLSW
jgi:hypothetical protein